MTATASGGRPSRVFAWIVMRLRFVLLLGWIAAAVAAAMYLPPAPASGQALTDLVPANAAPVRTEIESLRMFSVPVLSRIAVVQRVPQGLSVEAQARVVRRAVDVDSGNDPDIRRSGGAFPILNTLGLFPGSRESSTTAITYLFFRPDISLEDQDAIAHRFAARTMHDPGDGLVGVTGAIPARLKQSDIVIRYLPYVEALTVLLVTLIVGLYFRSVGPPLVTLAAAALAYTIATRVVAWAGDRAGVQLPRDLEPVIVALLLGIVTDYSIFFLSGFRYRIAQGERRLKAAQATTADFAPIVFTAGLIVAAGTAALLFASLGFLRALGPALALTVGISLAVAITFIPSVLGVFGGMLFWPRRFEPVQDPRRSPEAGTAQMEAGPPRWRARLARFMTAKPVAAFIAVVCIGLLVMAATGLTRGRLGFTLVSGLPADSEEVRAAQAAMDGFAPGVLSPLEIVVRGQGLDAKGDQLERLRAEVSRQPGVAGAIGPAQQLGDLTQGVMVSKDGTAARVIAIFADDPIGGKAIDAFRALEDRMPSLLRTAGLTGATAAYAGDTALADAAVDTTTSDLVRVAIAAAVIDLLLLVVFLRGLVAPLYLLFASALGLTAALGLTVFLFQVVLGHDEITYYVPFAATVLLLSLGSDYNVFVVGRIWDEARARPLREATAIAAPRAARTITLAGFVLASSFALLAVVPVVQFREFAFVMTAGILLDSLLVRSLLVPALISVFGRASWWPGKGFRTKDAPVAGPAAKVPGGAPAPAEAAPQPR